MILVRPIPKLTDIEIAAFHERVNKSTEPDGCWIWTGSRKSTSEYGDIYLQCVKSYFPAHRVSYAIHNGECPIDKIVCHACDNPPCVNPTHLVLGTSKDNMIDMVAKGRWRGDGRRGTNHPRAKLSTEDINKIRELYASRLHSQISLGRMFGVHQVTISEIILGNRYVNDGSVTLSRKCSSISSDKRGRPAAKLTREQVEEIRWLYSTGDYTQDELAVSYGIAQCGVWEIVNHKSYVFSN